MKTIAEIIKWLLSIIGIGLQNQHDNELREDGARRVENNQMRRRSEIMKEAHEHRSKNNSSTDDDVLDRM